MVGGADVGVYEEVAGVFEGPVFGEGVLLALGVGFDPFDDAFKGFVFTDEAEGGPGADLWDGVDVVAAEEDAEVYELESKRVSSEVQGWESGKGLLRHTCLRSMSKPARTLSRWISRMGSLRCSLKVRWRRRMGESKQRVSMSSDAAA